MEAAELACTRELLGLSVRWMSAWLGKNERTYKRMEDGLEPIHGKVADDVDELAILTMSLVRHMIADPKALERHHRWVTYRTDADAREDDIHLWAAKVLGYDDGPSIAWPASWHRCLVARCREEVGGGITYYVPKDERD